MVVVVVVLLLYACVDGVLLNVIGLAWSRKNTACVRQCNMQGSVC